MSDGKAAPALAMRAWSYGCPWWARPEGPRDYDPAGTLAALGEAAAEQDGTLAALLAAGDDAPARAWDRWVKAEKAREAASAALWDGAERGLERQLRLANHLWNALVAAWRGHEAAKDEIWASDPAVAAAGGALAAAQEAAEAIRERMSAARKADRSTVPRPGDAAALKAAMAAVRDAKAARKAARDAALPALAARFEAAKAARHAVVKATYADFVQDRGLGWATYNDIVRRRFPGAVKRVEDRRKQGLPADLRFRRFDGTGTLTVQVMTAGDDAPRTIPALNSGSHPRSGVLRLEPWADPSSGRRRGPARHGVLSLVIGRSRAHGPLPFRLPVVLHRCLPADADVSEVKVSRRRTGLSYRWSVSVIATIPAPGPPVSGAPVAVRLERATLPGGRVQVAVIGSPVPLPPVPPSLARVVAVSAGGRAAQVAADPAWRRLLDRDDGIRSVRDQNLDVIKRKVIAALRAEPALAGPLGAVPARVALWRSAGRMARLARAWPEDHPLAGTLREWRLRDVHLAEYEGHERAQVLACRRDAWRNAAAWLCQGAAEVTVSGEDLTAAKRKPRDEEDPEAARGARAQLQDTAPGEFRAVVVAAAAARGIPVVTVTKAKGGGR